MEFEHPTTRWEGIERVDYRPDAAHAAGMWMGKTESSAADIVIAFIELYIYNHAQL